MKTPNSSFSERLLLTQELFNLLRPLLDKDIHLSDSDEEELDLLISNLEWILMDINKIISRKQRHDTPLK